MKIISILLLFFIAGCGDSTRTHRVLEKSYLRRYETNEQLPKCICFYSYYTGSAIYWFQDSCHKYSIGDTIK